MNALPDLLGKKRIILAQEKQFAARLASFVLVKPQLSAWMIFIPFIFIFYFQDVSKFKKQRKEFMTNWLLSRKKALNEAEEAIDEQRKPDTQSLAEQANLTAKATEKYYTFLEVMANHYTLLFNVQGYTYKTYDALVRSAYGNQEGFLDFINQLTDAEKALNKALVPELRKTSEDVGATIKKIERGSKKLRQQEIDKYF
ncbi:NF038143 family protein [Desulfobulbus sp. TB]|nr:NF038143 family protein [Desulfobulbus sp. TB]